jgi:hypothetical protein
MIVRRKIFERYTNYKFNIPYKPGDRVLVKRGDTLRESSDLITKRGSNIKQSFYLPEKIGVEISKLPEYIKCMDGVFVNKGDILAEKTLAGGLSVKRVLSPAQGVVDLSRLGSGYLDLLGEESEVVVKSTFAGIVEGVDPVEGINIVSDSYALDLLSISDILTRSKEERKIFGEFVVLGDGKDLVLHADNSDYQDKIVFVGKYLHTSLLNDLFEKGALFVLTYSMDYEDFRRQGLPVGVIGGFGEIYSSKQIIELISSMRGKFAVLDYDENQIFFITKDKTFLSKEELFVRVASGSTILSRSLSNYGMLGKILSVEEEGLYVNVQWEGGQRSIISLASVEFVSL